MARQTGTYRFSVVGGEELRAFVPHPLPPAEPALQLDEATLRLLNEATGALSRLSLAAEMVASPDWFLYGFVRREAVITSEIEGTQATLQDVATFEATNEAARPDDVREVCNYVAAMAYARREIARPKGLPLSVRLLCGAHQRLMKGVRGADKQPGELRRSQNWIGGSRPGNARFVPPPPEMVPECLGDLERWLYATDPLPVLVRAGMAHVQFETIHPFLDGNGRIGRLLVVLLLEHWGLLRSPLLYLSVAFRRRQPEYYARLSAVRTAGDWEGWTTFFLECVLQAADDGVATALRLSALMGADRDRLMEQRGVTVSAMQLLEKLPVRPVVTLPLVVEMLGVSKPTASKAIGVLEAMGVLKETSGKQRDRVYAYQAYLDVLAGG